VLLLENKCSFKSTRMWIFLDTVAKLMVALNSHKLVAVKNCVGQLTLSLPQDIKDKESAEAKKLATDEALSREIIAHKGLEYKLARVESAPIFKKQALGQTVADKEKALNIRISEVGRLQRQLEEVQTVLVKEREEKEGLKRQAELDKFKSDRGEKILKAKNHQLKTKKKWILEKGMALYFMAFKGSQEYNDTLYTLTARVMLLADWKG
jgi:hypothetical protein